MKKNNNANAPSVGSQPFSTSEMKADGESMKKSYAYIGMLVAFFLGLVVGSMVTAARQTAKMTSTSAPVVAGVGNQVSATVEKRIAELEARLHKNPREKGLWVELGNAYFDADKPDQAISAYETALKGGERSPDVLTDLGIMYRKKMQFARALELFQEAMKIDEKHLQSRINAGVVYFYDLSQVEPAIEMWEQALKLNPSIRVANGDSLSDLVFQLKHRKN